MKSKTRNKIRKSITRICITSIILLIIGLFLFSENVHKIVMVDMVKERVALLTMQIQDIVDNSNKLLLNTKVNLNAANGKGGVDLDWSTYDSTDKIFKAYQKKEGSSEWESISTVDFYSKGIEPIKVLNVYPNSTVVTFKYSDGTTQKLPKAASLKVWIEGGTINGTAFKAYGINPITGEQIIKVTSVNINDFNNDPNIIWNYDVVMFGTWDCNGGTFPNNNAINEIEQYIKSGYGVLAGHDSIGWEYNYYNLGLSKLRKYFNIDIGYFSHKTTNLNLIDYKTSWAYSSSYVKVGKTGLLTNFPYELPLGTILSIPVTHTCSNAAKGNIWMTFVNGKDSMDNWGSANNYYKAGGKGNPYYYLTTWNNTAMIQTGHSNCDSTDDERKVLANTLFYLKQLTKATSSTDNSSQDLKAPNAPTISATRIGATDNIKVSYNSKDNGSTYSFYVEAFDSNNSSIKLETSNQRTETVTTGTKGFYYIINANSSNNSFDIKGKDVQYTEDDNIIIDLSNNGKYIHMKAVDRAGNVSAPSILKIDVKLIAKVTKDLVGGTILGEEGPIEKDIILGNSIELEIPKKENNIFEGWYLDPEYRVKISGSEYVPKDDVTLYAKWKKEYTITVDNEKEGHTYNSYQIFQGDYYEKEEIIIDENGEEKIVKVPILSNIEWSSELQKEVEEGKTHGNKILELLQENEKDKEESNKLYTNCKTAEDIVKVLQGKPNDGDAIKEFTDIVGKYILENNIPITKGTSTVVEGTDSEGNIDKNYKITHLEPGYYIVIDAKANEKNDAYSRYLIDVVQDVTMEPKTSIPRLNKKVNGNNIKTLISGVGGESSAEYVEDEKRNTATYKKESDEYNAEDYDIEFELKSYIPDVTGYSTYKFEVIDILGKGFDYDRNSVKVMLEESEYQKTREKTIKEENSESTKIENTEEIINPEDAQENGEEIIQNSESKKEIVENYTIRDVVITEENYNTYKTYFEEEGKEYPERYAESNYGKTLILIELNNLVEQVNAGIAEKGQDIFIKYKAKLNGKGEVGNRPNINEAYVKYSNDPYHNEKITQTTTENTYTYTIDLNISKIAEIKKSINNSNLENENLVEENDDSENENLVQKNNNSENENLVEDIENSEVLEELKYLEGAEFEIYNGPEYIKGDSLLPVKNPNRKLIATIKTDEILDSEGNIINKAGQAIYSSLGAGTYYIKETKSPEGYNKLREEIVIEVKANCDEYGKITWTVENAENNLVFAQIGMKEIIKENVNEETGEIITEIVKTEIPEIKLQVENTLGFELPVTGGSGTEIFIILGVSIMTIVIIYLNNKEIISKTKV